MRMLSGVTDQVIYFVAVDATDFTTRETGLSGFTVYRSRNGAAAVAMTTPTVTEVDSSNMPGVYKLLLDEDMTIGAGNDSEAMVFHITHAGMAPVTREIELYRAKITAGQTLAVASSAANITQANVRSAVGLASANLDAQLSTIDTAVDAIDPLDASGIRAALGMASADLDTQLGAIDTAVGAISVLSASDIRDAIGMASANLDTQLAALPTAAENAAGLLDLSEGVETGLTVRQAMRLIAAVLFGKASGLDTTEVTFRDTQDGTDRVVATVDQYGNRTAVTLDGD